ncbi:hypothetical protein K435DRAFT_756883 [Dendrothele bispora CBS 962.96]|uniref:Uncharacterized protein n=1 Tax=Dendrothele bispora (strain CBS 962.96) TaxID=1314807 RepID=A0A4S8LWK9_DENBC|nr:hypothetical protein K435DRAFT_756883 [Dendrothele bispora CBS 962.96]
MDWYKKAVNETPCTTYQRLRQICNPQYQVGTLNTSLPPDTCNEQVADCCCNTISFSLSMLCIAVYKSGSAENGFDPPPGMYQKYLTQSDGSTCSPMKSQSFPTNIQSSVCNNKIKIFDAKYSRIGWPNGSLFLVRPPSSLTLLSNGRTHPHILFGTKPVDRELSARKHRLHIRKHFYALCFYRISCSQL